jgi:hypothetical protein
MTLSIAFGLCGTAFMCIWSTIMYAYVDERQQRAARRDLIARAAIRRRHDRELAEIRGYLAAVDSHLRYDAPEQAPITQPIILPPAPDDGPPTEPADVLFVMAKAVGARQPADYQQTEPTREQKNAAWVESELSRFNFAGRKR